MVKSISSLLLIIYSSMLLNAQNPFEIRSRLVDAGNTTAIVIDSSINTPSIDTIISKNPFEIGIHSEIVPQDEGSSIEVVTTKNQQQKGSDQFIFWVLIFSLVLLVIVINANRAQIIKLYRSVLNENMLRLIQREEGGGFSSYFALLFLLFSLNAGLFVYLSFIRSDLSSGFRFFSIAVLFVMGIYLTRHLSMYILGSVFPVHKEASTYNFTILLYNSVFGIFLLPVNALLAYSPDNLSNLLIVIGLIIFSSFYLLRFIRGFLIAMGTPNFSFLHFFIYFCTCEIAPFLIVMNLITTYNFS